MRILRELSSYGSRPYPLDRERRRRVMVALAEKNMSISLLAKKLGITRTCVSETINGRRLSEKTEKRIAKFLGKRKDYLFPKREACEIERMREKEAVQRGETA